VAATAAPASINFMAFSLAMGRFVPGL
jgi:hypothetical protein